MKIWEIVSSRDKNLPCEILPLSHFGFKYCSVKWSNFWVSCDPQPCLALPSLLKILIPHYIFQAQVRGRKCRRKIKKSGGHKEIIEYQLKEIFLLLLLQKLCVKCCMMVDSVPRWPLSLSWPIQSDHLSIADRMIPPLGREHSHGKTQYIPGKQVLVRSWLWKIYLFLLFVAFYDLILKFSMQSLKFVATMQWIRWIKL